MEISKPHFELTNVYDDGSHDEPQIVPIAGLPWETKSSRRGFLGASISVSALLAMRNLPKVFNAHEESEQAGKPQFSKVLLAHTEGVYSVAFSPDAKLLASGSSDKTVKLWQMPKGKLEKSLKGHASDVRAVSFSPDGKLLASASEDGTVKLWQMPEGTLKKH
ncbi:MAG: WD40 repeat domain-containing protein [Saprospiraceae bacterium]